MLLNKKKRLFKIIYYNDPAKAKPIQIAAKPIHNMPVAGFIGRLYFYNFGYKQFDAVISLGTSNISYRFKNFDKYNYTLKIKDPIVIYPSEDFNEKISDYIIGGMGIYYKNNTNSEPVLFDMLRPSILDGKYRSEFEFRTISDNSTIKDLEILYKEDLEKHELQLLVDKRKKKKLALEKYHNKHKADFKKLDDMLSDLDSFL